MPYLTKSRFKLALECTAKLFYNDNKQYANKAFDDKFLEELARGGFQVGALAQCYHPGGVLIETKEHQLAFQQTMELLKEENVTIFEAALMYENCFIRADVLFKEGAEIHLVEVKAKSYAKSEDSFWNKIKPGINSKWEPYLYDVAFQTWVTRQSLQTAAMGHLQVTPYLMLADKETTTTVEGLNQRFFVDFETKNVETVPELCTPEALGKEVLIKVDVSKEVQYLLEQPIEGISFVDFVKKCSDAATSNQIILSDVGLKCKKCGFVATPEQIQKEKLNGFHHCWKEKTGLTDEDFKKAMSWEIWESRSAAKWLESKKYFMDQLDVSDLNPNSGKPSKKVFRGIARVERQDIQRVKTFKQDFSPHVDKGTLRQYFSEWAFPLHCIDFETTAVALPFHAGMRPYEQIAFQFSHHIIREDGTVVHQTEWINAQPGHFPNFDFVRALNDALTVEGTIFRYAAHENTVLCQIHTQLQNSSEPDKEELMQFIESITTKQEEIKGKNQILWSGERTMVDLLQVVRESWYSLYAKGTNSIKSILPAVLNSSKMLQEKYSQPVYGTSTMQSKNFQNFSWIQKQNGLVENPYRLLEPVFSREEDEMLDKLLMNESSDIADGGAAMAAYGRMQFTRMTDAERNKIIQALLRYCELDTLAMVMILEEFRELSK